MIGIGLLYLIPNVGAFFVSRQVGLIDRIREKKGTGKVDYKKLRIFYFFVFLLAGLSIVSGGIIVVFELFDCGTTGILLYTYFL
jgi:hypothetical protein